MNAKSQPDTPAQTPTASTYGPKSVAIIGGGIAGLFCAYALQSLGYEVVVFESSDVLGGRIRSFRFNPALLNELERKSDPTREPIAQQAILQNALKASGYTKRADYDKREWDELEFNAEFGPMRIELDVQKMLGFLIDHLKIPPLNKKPAIPDDSYGLVHMQGFPPFSSPGSKGDPIYDLKPEEEGKNPLELLKLGVCRAVVDLTFDKQDRALKAAEDEDFDPEKTKNLEARKYFKFKATHADLVARLGKAAATQRPIIPVFEAWVRHQIHEDDLWIIQRYGRVPVMYGAEDADIHLHTMGFWNLMAAYLSHNALAKVRDLGSFYHLIPENPNAAEWLTWWMRQVSISGQLQGIFGGMQTLVEKLVQEMGITITTSAATGPDEQETLALPDPLEPDTDKGRPGALKIYRNATVTELETTDDKIAVTVKDTPQTSATVRNNPETSAEDLKTSAAAPKRDSFARVIMALPTVPAEKLIQSSNLWGDNPDREKLHDKLAAHLHSALPFQLLKVFFIVRDRWWEEPVLANPDVSRYPTREVYFWKSRIKGSRRGLIMLYTDRPASSFWANYVPAPTQKDIDELCRHGKAPKDEAKAVQTLRARLKSRFVEYVNEVEGKAVITPDDIIWCGIMDWGREPYGAASHTWRPNREYWNTLAALADWPLGADAVGPHLHVCGEAYSDYHAFIEGSLRSAVHVLTQIIKADDRKTTKDALIKVLQKALGVDKTITDAIDSKDDEPEPKSGTDRDRKTWDARKYVKDFYGWSKKLDTLKDMAQKPE